MSEVPFSRLGDGQSARLVYQVMGGGGPIPNPSGIRFMDPGFADSSATGGGPVPGMFSLTGAVELLDLGVGVANLGLTAATLAAVRRVERKVDQLWLETQYQTTQLQEVTRCLSRVDVNVAEQNLREALRYVLPRSATAKGFDFDVMDPLVEDIDKFTDSLGGWGYGLAPNLRLSTDVRAMLTGIWHVVHGAQLSLISVHNQQANGDPDQCKQHPLDGEMTALLSRLPHTVVDRLHIVRALSGAAQELGDKVYSEFTFAGESDRKRYADWVRDGLGGEINAILAATDPLSSALAEMVEPFVKTITTDEDVEEVQQWLLNYLAAWSMSDAGLLFRTEVALQVNRDADYWSCLSLGEKPSHFTVDPAETMAAFV